VKVEQWVPPEVEQPSAWQRAQVVGYLGAKAEVLAAELARLTGGQALLGPISLCPVACGDAGRELGLREEPWADCDLLTAVVAAALGYDVLPQLDLDGPAESAVAAALSRCVRNWFTHAVGPISAEAADFVIEIGCTCLGVQGRFRVLASWSPLWRSASNWLASTCPRPRLPLNAIKVLLTGVVRGPTLRVAEAISMKVGDVVALPVGAERRMVLTLRGLPFALGTLGALSEHLAVRVETVAGGTGRDGG